MIEVEIHVEGLKDKSSEEMAGIEKAIMDGLMATALTGQNIARLSIERGKKTGYLYPRGKRMHQASAPGQPPATDTGHLANNIFAEVNQTEAMTVEIRSKAPYSIHLEYGTRHMAARPFLRPAGWQAGVQGEKIVKAYVQAASKR